MKHAAALALCLALSLPASAEQATPDDLDEGVGLLQRGAEMILRGIARDMEPKLEALGSELGGMLSAIQPALRDLAAMIDDVRNYEAPEMLPNGDIIIRRRLVLPPVADGETDL